MGGNQSQETNNENVPPIVSGDEKASETPTGGYRISANLEDVNKQLEEAYQRGREESLRSVNETIEFVAGQVYSNVNAELASIQTKQLEESKKYAEEIEKKLAVDTRREQSRCEQERSAVVACLRQESPLACESLAESFSSCAYQSVLATSASP